MLSILNIAFFLALFAFITVSYQCLFHGNSFSIAYFFYFTLLHAITDYVHSVVIVITHTISIQQARYRNTLKTSILWGQIFSRCVFYASSAKTDYSCIKFLGTGPDIYFQVHIANILNFLVLYY